MGIVEPDYSIHAESLEERKSPGQPTLQQECLWNRESDGTRTTRTQPCREGQYRKKEECGKEWLKLERGRQRDVKVRRCEAGSINVWASTVFPSL